MRSIAREGDPGLHREHRYFVYMLASSRNGTLYTGVTNNLVHRIAEHRDGQAPGFTCRYDVTILVWYEELGDVQDAIAREKQITGWNRAWKIRLIEKTNPVWNDLMIGLV
jgi:putative endonuclease